MTRRSKAVSNLAFASSPADADAVASVVEHHAQLAGGLEVRVTAMLSAVAGARGAFDAARRDALSFCRDELVPHAAAEERALYPTAADDERGRLLVDGMLMEHRALVSLVDELAADDLVRAAASAYALLVMFKVHLSKENDLLLALLAADPDVSLADVVERMHEPGVRHDPEAVSSGTGEVHASCSCGDANRGVPELDVRAVPHAIRHATVFGAFDAIPSGGSLLLVAPHDPLPLLRQLSDRAGGSVAVEYEQRGPDAWRLVLTRT